MTVEKEKPSLEINKEDVKKIEEEVELHDACFTITIKPPTTEPFDIQVSFVCVFIINHIALLQIICM